MLEAGSQQIMTYIKLSHQAKEKKREKRHNNSAGKMLILNQANILHILSLNIIHFSLYA